MANTGQNFDKLVANAFRSASWRVHPPRQSSAPQPDLIAERGGQKLVIEIKRSSEGRRDRVIPLLSQAILEAQAFARDLPGPVVPVAVVAAEHLPPSVVDSVQSYAERVAAQMVVGLVDSLGLRAFWGHGMESLNARPTAKENRAHRRLAAPPPPRLFSGLNQWMLKILLSGSIPAQLLSAPRSPYANPTQLARAAEVSVMSALRLVRQLESDGFLDTDSESLALARIPELLTRWSVRRESVREFPVRWLVQRDRSAIAGLLRSHSSAPASPRTPRACLGLFAAAEALGFGFVHGVPPHILLERFDPALLSHWGLSADGAAHSPDAFIRIPAHPEAVFRAAVLKEGIPCADILEVWLDVSQHPSRGREQADYIARRALAPLMGKL